MLTGIARSARRDLSSGAGEHRREKPRARHDFKTKFGLTKRELVDLVGIELEPALRASEPAQYSSQRLFSILFGVFSAMALALALVGIFSLVAYSVAQRTASARPLGRGEHRSRQRGGGHCHRSRV